MKQDIKSLIDSTSTLSGWSCDVNGNCVYAQCHFSEEYDPLEDNPGNHTNQAHITKTDQVSTDLYFSMQQPAQNAKGLYVTSG